MALLDLLGRRWSLRILWELKDGAVGFRALQERCDGMSPSSLSQRLGELRSAGIVEDLEEGLALSSEGRTLAAALLPLHTWAERWSARS
jgi:DNA-binding HxlR family transcriptional regulator